MKPGHLRTAVSAVWLLAAGLATARAQEEPLQSGTAGRTVILLPRAGGATIELGEERRQEIALPERSFVSSFQALARGWIAAADTPTPQGDRHLLLLRSFGLRVEPLPEPGDPAPGVRLSPIALVDQGRLVGLAWLEGDAPRGLAVRAAAWNGSGWSPPQWVSRPGPGSQLALTGVVLRDGSWLLAWSAFDGEDDEIVWSRRSDGAWSGPKRVAAPNAVPDITPSLAAAPEGGAWLAWSRFERTSATSGYRLRTARFADGEWRDERPQGELGSLYPGFVTGGREAPVLLYLQAEPRAWTLLTFDRAGQVEKRAAVASTLDRPVVEIDPAGGVAMRWPAQSRIERPVLERLP